MLRTRDNQLHHPALFDVHRRTITVNIHMKKEKEKREINFGDTRMVREVGSIHAAESFLK
jgi:hypothetical protein